jgi:hypothetical protein
MKMAKKHPFIYSTFPETLEALDERVVVADLKKLIAAKVPNFKYEYAMVMESHGDTPDRELTDSETVEIKHTPHFYSQPPAHFG